MLLNLYHHATLYGISLIISRGINLLLLPILTITLSPDELGVFEILTTLGILINLFVGLEISQGLSRYWNESKNKKEETSLLSTTIWFTVILHLIFITTAIFFSSNINRWMFGEENYLSILEISIVYFGLNGIFQLLLNQFRWETKSKLYGVVNIFNSLLTLTLVFILSFIMSNGFYGVMLAYVLSVICSTCLCILLLQDKIKLILDIEYLKILLKFALPLVPASLAVFTSLYINRFVLNYFENTEQVGLFGVSNRIGNLSILMIVGIQAGLTPLIYKNYSDTDTPHKISQLFNYFISVSIIGCLILGFLASFLIKILAGKDYIESANLVVLLAPAALIFQMYIFTPGMAIEKKTNLQMFVAIISGLIAFICNWVLIQYWGIWGAALATLISSIVYFLCWMFASQKYYKIPFVWRKMTLPLVFYIILSSLGVAINNYEFNIIISFTLKFFMVIIMLLVIIKFKLFSLAEINKFKNIVFKSENYTSK